MKKITPHIIGIGAAHAGLGVISEFLAEHPATANHLPARNFFNTKAYEKKGHVWYEDQLAPEAGILVGDCTPGYLTDPRVPERIAHDYPDAKLCVIVRQPVERMVAEYVSLRSIDKEASMTTAAHYLATHPELQERSRYGEHLSAYFSYYSPLQLHVIVYEDLREDPLKTLSLLYEFYGIDKNFIPKRLRHLAPQPEEPRHKSLIYRGKKLVKTLYKKATYKEPAPMLPEPIKLHNWLTPEEEALFVHMFRQDSEVLSPLLARDMGMFWGLTPASAEEGLPT